MLNLNDFHLFVQVIERGGFSAASRALSLPKSTLSDRIRALETALGARLLNRTSRQLGLTDAGVAFYAEAVDMVRRAEAAEAAVRSRAEEPSGLVRYTTAVSEAQFAVRPALCDFLKLYPKVSIFEHATDREVDLFAEGFDVAIRAHPKPLRNSRLIQRVLASVEWHIFASPDYLSSVEPIREPEDLVKHPSLFTRRAQVSPAWRLKHESKGVQEHILQSAPRIVSDSMAGLKDMARAGLGVMALPAYVCQEEVQSGALIRVLPEWTAGHSTLSALIPESRGLLPAVRAFLDHLAAVLPQNLKV
jgi:DNA-binding transcriptional LysR family regulator